MMILQNVKKILADFSFVKMCFNFYKNLKSQYGFNLFYWISGIFRFFIDLRTFQKIQNNNFKISSQYYMPFMSDKTSHTPIEPTYFFQDTWAARKIFESKPERHYDIGSSVKSIGIISQFIPVTMIDIRPIDLKLQGLDFQKGSILKIPFPDKSIKSLSSLCVIEHIGLGRYGDPIDAFGSEKAVEEIQRVLAESANLYISLPVDCECRVYFNAHRAFTREFVMQLFGGLELLEEKYHYGRELFDNYKPEKGFGTGLFHFRKV